MKKSNKENSTNALQLVENSVDDKLPVKTLGDCQVLDISSMEVTITQFPMPKNGNVAIVQTALEVGSKAVSMAGFATPETAFSMGSTDLLNAAFRTSRKIAIEAALCIKDPICFYEQLPLSK